MSPLMVGRSLELGVHGVGVVSSVKEARQAVSFGHTNFISETNKSQLTSTVSCNNSLTLSSMNKLFVKVP